MYIYMYNGISYFTVLYPVVLFHQANIAVIPVIPHGVPLVNNVGITVAEILHFHKTTSCGCFVRGFRGVIYCPAA